MLAEIYIEAPLVDEELADQVWESWVAREISDETASLMWWIVGNTNKYNCLSYCTHQNTV